MPTSIPPGAILLAKTCAGILVPAATTYGVLYVVPLATDVQIPGAVVWAAMAFALPLKSFITRSWTSYKRRKEAEELGAVLIPTWKGKWPGNFDLLLHLNEASKTDYLGGQCTLALIQYVPY